MRLAVALTLILAGCSSVAESPEERQALEEAFEASMRGAALVGQFTVFPAEGAEPAAEGEDETPVPMRSERYEIEKAVKVAGDLWTFHARIVFGSVDVTVPVPVKLVWAGDTPVVSVTDLAVPGIGTYTARVAFYRDAYAGMWWGRNYGGNMFGKIERPQ